MRLVSSFLLLLGSACQPTEFRVCPNAHTDPTKRLYQDVVTELIEHRFYHAYLSEQKQQVFSEHFQQVDHRVPTVSDSAWHQTKEAQFQHELFGDTAQFQTFYLNTTDTQNPQLAQLPDRFSSLRANDPIAALLERVMPQQPQAALDSLNSLQQTMQAEEFQLCTAKLRAATSSREHARPPQGAGTLSLSKVVFNARKDQALLTIKWWCGPRCGFGEVLLVENVQGRWHIKQAEQTWIS